MDISGYSAIVSGGASGMGAETARLLAKMGAKVAIIDKNSELAGEVARECEGVAIECDVTNAESAEQAISQAREANGPARICINCAGVAPAKRIVGREGPMSLDEFSQVIQINLIGTFNIMRLAAAEMMQLAPIDESEERGVIINTASIAAYEGQIGQSAYAASKGGVVSMTLPAAREFAQFGIRVNAIAPGLFATPMLLNMPKKVQSSLAENIPFPKRFGKPQEFAKLVQHIIDNEMLNGEVIRLDGALRMAAG